MPRLNRPPTRPSAEAVLLGISSHYSEVERQLQTFDRNELRTAVKHWQFTNPFCTWRELSPRIPVSSNAAFWAQHFTAAVLPYAASAGHIQYNAALRLFVEWLFRKASR